MIQWINVANLKWIWWELHRKLDLIRNLNTEGTTPPTPPDAAADELVIPITHLSDELKTISYCVSCLFSIFCRPFAQGFTNNYFKTGLNVPYDIISNNRANSIDDCAHTSIEQFWMILTKKFQYVIIDVIKSVSEYVI